MSEYVRLETLPMFNADHDGETYDADADKDRLNGQTAQVFELMRDGHWRSLAGISACTGAPEASVSARLRDLRKPKFGGYEVERKREGAKWMYRIVR